MNPSAFEQFVKSLGPAKSMKTTVTLRVPIDVKRELERLSLENQVSMSDILLEALAQFLGRKT